jgi:hypothetical protein
LTKTSTSKVRPITSLSAAVDGGQRFVREGEVLAANDPIVKGREELFEAK